MLICVLKGLCIGLVVGTPIGALGAIMVQRTLRHGFWAGIVTGLGSSLCDCLYAIVGALGLHIVAGFLHEHKLTFKLIGGTIVLVIGLSMFFRKRIDEVKKESARSYGFMFLSAILIGLTNPTVILTFCFGFTILEIRCPMALADGIWLVFGVLMGTLMWWALISSVTMRYRAKALEHQVVVNRCFGCFLFAVAIFLYGGCILGAC